MKVQGRTDQQYLTAMSHVIEGLRGDAVLIAQEIGNEKLNTKGDSLVDSGLGLLIREMKESVFPQTQSDAKELFRSFVKDGGPLSGQVGESMQHYTSRRKRSWKLLKELDLKLEIPDE